MTEYIKIISVMGKIYMREFEKIKHHGNKKRELNESTIAKSFMEGVASVRVIFEDTGKELVITPDSPVDDIKRYLGPAFLPKDKKAK